jgi:hypothetical protein
MTSSLRRMTAMPCAPVLRQAAVGAWAVSSLAVAAQTVQQVVKPPVSQAWVDVATFGGFAAPGGMGPGAMGGGSNPMSALGGLFGGGGGAADSGNRFGQTQTTSTGRWVDVTLYTRNNPQLAQAQQAVPAGFLSPALTLQPPKDTKGAPPEPGDERVQEPEERPKAKFLLYWGCGETVRPGQPRVLDLANMPPADMARLFQARRATQRGTHAATGRPVWPSTADTRMVPTQASLVGEHQFSGTGVPEGFRFQWPAAQDLMPALALKQRDAGGATQLEWQALPTARAYFISAMASRGSNEMVVWTSSEQPDLGFGLLDYQTNSAVDRWLKEQVLLAPQTTRCAVPKGALPAEGAMLRMIAYGSELNLAHPPRPTDPRVPWEPQWAVKVRVKSMTTAMLGMEMPEAPERQQSADTPPAADADKDKKPGVKDLLKGILGR